MTTDAISEEHEKRDDGLKTIQIDENEVRLDSTDSASFHNQILIRFNKSTIIGISSENASEHATIYIWKEKKSDGVYRRVGSLLLRQEDDDSLFWAVSTKRSEDEGNKATERIERVRDRIKHLTFLASDPLE